MRLRVVEFIFAVVVISVSGNQGSRRIPPGVREGDKAIAAGQQVEPPRGPSPRSFDPAVVKSEAAQLQGLADALPGQVDQITKGAMPKDVSANLKKIEKLAKHLRSEIMQ